MRVSFRNHRDLQNADHVFDRNPALCGKDNSSMLAIAGFLTSVPCKLSRSRTVDMAQGLRRAGSRNRLFVVVCALIALSQASPLAAEEPPSLPPLLTVDGELSEARLLEFSGKKLVLFAGPQETYQVPTEQLVYWGTLRPATASPAFVTEGGGLLLADVIELAPAHIKADSFTVGQLRLPRRSVTGIVFQWPALALGRDRLVDKLLDRPAEADVVLLANGDQWNGTVEAIGKTTIRVVTDLGAIDVDRYGVAAIRFRNITEPPPEADAPLGPTFRCWVGFADGSRLPVDDLTIDGDGATLTFAGRDLKQILTDDIVFLQPLEGRASYLSDSKPAGYRQLPYLSISWPYRLDRSVEGGLLRALGRLHLKGIGLHSAARISYRVPKDAKQFQAEAAIDETAEERGSAGFRVYVDGRAASQTVLVRGGQPPQPIRVDVAGAERLDLIVDFADRADQLDHANWLDARWIR